MGIEPTTSCLLDRRSNQLSYSANYEDIKKLLSYDLFSALSCYCFRCYFGSISHEYLVCLHSGCYM